jgi:hypothetical protein
VGSATWRYRARVRVHAPATVTPQMLAVCLGMLDVDFEVDGPPELVEQLGTLADRCRRAITRTGA